MKCACIDKIENLNLMADGQLPQEKVDELNNHMTVCSECKRSFDDIMSMKNALGKLTVEMPANLNENIMKAVRERTRKKPVRKFVYRYAAVAAACLVMVSVFFIYRGLNIGGMKESAEFYDADTAAMENFDARNEIEKSGEAESALLITEETENDSLDAPAEPVPAITAGGEYRYYSSAVNDGNTITVNPGGLSLDAGFGGMQDVFYASERYSLDDIALILKSDFQIKDPLKENNSIYFQIGVRELPAIEARLGLAAAEPLITDKKNVTVRIISFKED